jgi:redox-sensing transcriptional repressor
MGTRIRRLIVQNVDTVETENERIGARLGIVAVPAWEAQNVADRLVRAGVTGIINFAPIRLHLPDHVISRDVCFICELTVLSYLIQEAERACETGTAIREETARQES